MVIRSSARDLEMLLAPAVVLVLAAAFPSPTLSATLMTRDALSSVGGTSSAPDLVVGHTGGQSVTGSAGDAGGTLAETTGFWLWGFLPVLGVGDLPVVDRPDEHLTMLPNRPNPFGDETRIRFVLPTAEQPTLVRVEIFDVTGRRVRSFDAGTLNLGAHSIVWDGRDEAGGLVPGGIYLARISAAGFHESQRVVLVR